MIARKSIKDRLAQIEARRKTSKTRLGKQERKEDTRHKVLPGVLGLHCLGEDRDGGLSSLLGEWLRRELPGFLTRDAAGVLQVFGVNDHDSARLISALLGQETVVFQTTGRALDSEKSRISYIEQHSARSLMTQDEVRNLPTDAELLFLVGTTANHAGKLVYYQDPEFTGLYDAH